MEWGSFIRKLDSDTVRANNKLSFDNFFYLYILISVANFYILWVSAGYLDIDIFNNLSTITRDKPGNIEMPDGLIGHHYFGDFVLQYLYAKEQSYWINSIIPLNIYPPISMLIFDFFTILPIKQSFIAYTIMTLISILYPSLDIIFNKSRKSGLQFLIITLLSIGTIATLDRGNNIGLLVGPLYLVLKLNKSWLKDAILIIMGFIKIYPFVLLLIEFKLKKVKTLFIMGIFGILLNLIVFKVQKGSITENIFKFFDAYQAYDGRNSYLSNSVSLRATFENLFNVVSSIFQLNNNEVSMKFFMDNGLFFSVICVIIFTLFLAICRDLPLEVKYLFGVYTLWATVPISFVYTTVLLIAVIGSIISKDLQNNIIASIDKDKRQLVPYILLLFAVIITFLPISFTIHELNIKFMVMNFIWLAALISFIFRRLSAFKFSNKISI